MQELFRQIKTPATGNLTTGHTATNKYQWIEPGEKISPSQQSPSNIFCLTLYNEPYDLLIKTLFSIAVGVSENADQSNNSDKTSIYIICDGYDRMDESVLSEFLAMGWIDWRADTKSSELGMHVFNAWFHPELLPEEIYSQDGDNDRLIPIEVSICIKPKNQGKLNSHKWFFSSICPQHQPDYCFQIDAGTRLSAAAFAEMLRTFESNSDIGALASNVLIESGHKLDAIHAFQCMDFVIQRANLWPTENLCGYLSVVPGQFCGISWKALSNQTDDISSPVDKYLNGSESDDPATKVRYLAEDRVLGFELMANKGTSYRLSYAKNTECYTDACNSINELLEQRRRWVNSAFMCRHWMIANFHRVLLKNDANLGQLTAKCASFASMLWSHTGDFLQPLITLILLTFTWGSLTTLAQSGAIHSAVGASTFLVIASAWLLPTALAISKKLQKLSKKSTQIILWASACSFVAATTINVIASSGHYTQAGLTQAGIGALAVPLVLFTLVLLSATILNKSAALIGLKNGIQYFACSVPFNLMIYSYGFCNLSDTSWGTKGLTQGTSLDNNRTANKRLAHFSIKFLLTWACVNAGIFILVLWHNYLIQALTVIGIFYTVYFAIGLVGVISMTFSRNTIMKRCLLNRRSQITKYSNQTSFNAKLFK